MHLSFYSLLKSDCKVNTLFSDFGLFIPTSLQVYKNHPTYFLGMNRRNFISHPKHPEINILYRHPEAIILSCTRCHLVLYEMVSYPAQDGILCRIRYYIYTAKDTPYPYIIPSVNRL